MDKIQPDTDVLMSAEARVIAFGGGRLGVGEAAKVVWPMEKLVASVWTGDKAAAILADENRVNPNPEPRLGA